MRAEQGVYAAPPPAVLDALWELAPEDDLHDYGILMADYHEFQRVTRQDNYGLLDPLYKFPDGPVEVFLNNHPDGQAPVLSIHPFVKWRYDSDVTARIQISKSFCVHPSLIFRFEAQSHMCTSPPKELLRALLESGYTTEILNRFEFAYQRFREVKSAAVSSFPVEGLGLGDGDDLD